MKRLTNSEDERPAKRPRLSTDVVSPQVDYSLLVEIASYILAIMAFTPATNIELDSEDEYWDDAEEDGDPNGPSVWDDPFWDPYPGGPNGEMVYPDHPRMPPHRRRSPPRGGS